MGNARRKTQRRAEIAELRAAGRAAYANGKSRESNPWRGSFTENFWRWREGWDAAEYDEYRRNFEGSDAE